MPAKMARSAARPPFGLPERPVSVGTSRRSCGKTVKRQYLPPVRESSGESRFKGNRHDAHWKIFTQTLVDQSEGMVG
jgi:hypothetical protein